MEEGTVMDLICVLILTVESAIMAIILVWLVVTTLLYAYDKYFVFDDWYNGNGESFKNNITDQINTLRINHDLSPVTVVNTANGASIAKRINVDKPSLQELDYMLLDPDIRYVAISVDAPGTPPFSSSRLRHLEIGVL
jgi:hypothetical protein